MSRRFIKQIIGLLFILALPISASQWVLSTWKSFDIHAENARIVGKQHESGLYQFRIYAFNKIFNLLERHKIELNQFTVNGMELYYNEDSLTTNFKYFNIILIGHDQSDNPLKTYSIVVNSNGTSKIELKSRPTT